MAWRGHEHHRKQQVAGLDQLQEAGVPSLKECKKLSIKGKVKLSADTVFKGEVTIINPTDEWVTLKSGTYENAEIDVTKQ